MKRTIQLVMLFGFTGSKFSFEPLDLAKGSGLHFSVNSGPTTFCG